MSFLKIMFNDEADQGFALIYSASIDSFLIWTSQNEIENVSATIKIHFGDQKFTIAFENKFELNVCYEKLLSWIKSPDKDLIINTIGKEILPKNPNKEKSNILESILRSGEGKKMGYFFQSIGYEN